MRLQIEIKIKIDYYLVFIKKQRIKMKSICVFTGSNLSDNQLYNNAAVVLGKEIAKRQINLIYGGGKNGLMGLIADSVLQSGGTVIGVITHALNGTEGHNQLSKLYITESMQERKKLMSELSDGYLILPGGLGTLDEFFEIWNEAKLEMHKKPIGLLNINNFYSELLGFIDHAIREGFCTQQNKSLINVEKDENRLLDFIESGIQ